jgi:hypothetical protein
MSLQNCKLIGPVKPEDYHRESGRRGQVDFVMSQSELKVFEDCPEKWILGVPREQTDAMEWGNWLDCRVLDEKRFHATHVKTPEFYEGAGKRKADGMIQKKWNMNADVCSDWDAEQRAAGLIPVKHKDWAEIEACYSALARRADLIEIIRTARTQQMIVGEWLDEATKLVIPIKGLIDIVPATGPSLLDFKQNVSAAPAKWMWQSADLGNHLQANFYLSLWNAAHPNDQRKDFGFIVQEPKAPFHVERHLLEDILIQEGRRRWTNAICAYCQCLKKNEWPGYPPANAGSEKRGLWHVTQLHEKMIRP